MKASLEIGDREVKILVAWSYPFFPGPTLPFVRWGIR